MDDVFLQSGEKEMKKQKPRYTCLYCHQGLRIFEDRFCNIICADAHDGVIDHEEWGRLRKQAFGGEDEN